jgi:formamidopyrimidine-DNA glycosylase
MPEVPEYHYTSDIINESFANKKITKTVLLPKAKWPKESFNVLIGKRLHETIAHGKYLFFIFKDFVLESKFGLFGEWKIDDETDAKLMFEFENGKSLYYSDKINFGNIRFINADEMESIINNTYDPIKENITSAIMNEFLQLRRIKNKTIAEALMDQKYLVGIGNYLRSEILYKSKLSPFTLCDDLDKDEIKRLIRAINKLPRKVYILYKENKEYKPDVYSQTVTPKGEKVFTEMIKNRTIYYVRNDD